jgi:polysaccharide export outer membrane protein
MRIRSTAVLAASALVLAALVMGTAVKAAEAGSTPASADVAAMTPEAAWKVGTFRYRIQPGDLLTVSVWKEKELQSDVLVRPDGGLSFPLAGDIDAEGLTPVDLQKILVERLSRYIPDPVVTVSVKLIGGNRIYVIGKVSRPGEFDFSRPIDVMQALALAGGATPFAALNEIVILRRENGQQRALPFRYGDVEHGKGLRQNVLLESGDTVVVP